MHTPRLPLIARPAPPPAYALLPARQHNACHAEDTLAPWKKYNTTAPDFLNDLKEMAAGRGHWINATAACTWTLP